MAIDEVNENSHELLIDADAGLTLRPEIQARLRRQLENPILDEENVSAAEVARRRGLEW